MGPKARTVKFYSTVSDRPEVIHLISRLFSGDGGPGSGNHNHKGRPGEVGGSAPEGSSKSAESTGTEHLYSPEFAKKNVEIRMRACRAKAECDLKAKKSLEAQEEAYKLLSDSSAEPSKCAAALAEFNRLKDESNKAYKASSDAQNELTDRHIELKKAETDKNREKVENIPLDELKKAREDAVNDLNESSEKIFRLDRMSDKLTDELGEAIDKNDEDAIAKISRKLQINAVAFEEAQIDHLKKAALAQLIMDREESLAGDMYQKEFEESGLSEADFRRKKAVEEFGLTPDYHEAGWILPDGGLLDFDGSKNESRGERMQDHRDIARIFGEGALYDVVAMQEFRNDGNVRLYPEVPGINVCSTVEPSEDQYDAIRDIIDESINNGEGQFCIDFSDEYGNMFGQLAYSLDPEDGEPHTQYLDADEVINDIKNFYKTGDQEEFGKPTWAHDKKAKAVDGGPGSGNFSHAGRPGKVGGSAPDKGSAKTESSSVLKEKSDNYWDLKPMEPEEAENFDIWKFVEEENKRQEEEKKAKEAGFAKSAEKGVEGLSKTYHFKGMVEAAKAAKGDYRAFVKGMSGSQKEALREQYKETMSEEHFTDYVKRIQSMLAAKDYVPDPVNKPVNGKDISETYEYKGSNDFSETGSEKIDTVIEDVIHQQGFDGIPKVVSKDEFDRIAKEHPEMPLLYRSFTAADADTLKTYNQQLENGFWYVDCGTGGAEYGQGMYAAGVFTDEPATLKDVHRAFGNAQSTDFVVDNNGQYWELDSEGNMSEINDDDWFEPGKCYLFADKYDNEGHMIELVDMSDEGFGLQWRDRNTGEMFDFDQIMGKGFGSVRECERSTKEQAYERDLSGAMSEMRHYRKGAEFASTREMTLDPSARIIDYDEALDIANGDLTREEKKEYFRKELDNFRKQLDEKYGKEESPEKFIEEYAFKGDFGLLEDEDWPKYLKACEGMDHEKRDRLLQKGENAGRGAYGRFQLETSEIRRERRKKFERLGDVGVCMAALGYDAINAFGHGESGSYMVVLNRTKVILSDREVNPYN